MAGQSAMLSLKEAKAMQERVQCGTHHVHTHGEGAKESTGPTGNRKKHPKSQLFDHSNNEHQD